jgi:hypothetical protein
LYFNINDELGNIVFSAAKVGKKRLVLSIVKKLMEKTRGLLRI